MSEVLAVFFGGTIIAQVLFQFAGVTSHPLVALTAKNPDMLAISASLAKLLLLQFTGWFALIIVFTLLHQQKLKHELKLSLGGKKVFSLIGIGILAWCVGDIANKVVFLVDQSYDLGVSVPWREALLNAEKTPEWWLVMFVGSFGLIPILEEVLWRGYVQSKLVRYFSPSVGIGLTAGLFVFSHAQYHQLDLYHSATIIALSISAVVLGWITHKTASIIPAIVMHAMLNFPNDGVALMVTMVLMVVVIIWQFKRISTYVNVLKLSEVVTRLNVANIVFLLAAIAAMLSLSQAPQLIIIVAGSCTALALIAGVVGLVKRLRTVN